MSYPTVERLTIDNATKSRFTTFIFSHKDSSLEASVIPRTGNPNGSPLKHPDGLSAQTSIHIKSQDKGTKSN